MSLKHLLLPCATLAMPLANAQLTVDTTMTPTELVQGVLVGTGITASTVLFNDVDGAVSHEQIGAFNNGFAALGWTNGMVIGTGAVIAAEGPNTVSSMTQGGGNFGYNDDDLNAINNFQTHDRAALEMDFIPEGNSMELLYAFASEEYPEYVCGTVNDVLGVFLSGPGIFGPYSNNAINLAVVPGGTIPVSINSVNSGEVGVNGVLEICEAADPDWQANSIHYLENPDTAALQFDGQTVGLFAFSSLKAGQPYHLKIAIADGGDTAFDSAVFFPTGGLTSGVATGVAAVPASTDAVRLAVTSGGLAVDLLPPSVDAVMIMDGTGRVVSTHPVAQDAERMLILLEGAAAGPYLLHLSGRNGEHRVMKFVLDAAR